MHFPKRKQHSGADADYEILPRMDRYTYHPSTLEVPLWIHRNSEYMTPDEQVILTCPECLRSSSHTFS
jgi:hypothetical protein